MAAAGQDTNMGRQSNLTLLKMLLTRLDFALWTGAGIIMLATMYYWLLLQVTTFETLMANLLQEPVYLAAVVILAPAVLLLFGLNFSLALFLFRSGGRIQGSGGALLGAFIGGFGAACPVCGAFLLSLIGVTTGLAALPFAGLEFWVVAAGLMLATLWKSTATLAESACEPQSQTAVCWHLPQVKRTHLLIALATLLVLLGNLLWMVAGSELWFV